MKPANVTNCTHFSDSLRTPSVTLLDVPGTLSDPPWTLQDPPGTQNVAPESMKKTLIFDKNSAKSNPETPQIWTDEVSEPALYVTSPPDPTTKHNTPHNQ